MILRLIYRPVHFVYVCVLSGCGGGVWSNKYILAVTHQNHCSLPDRLNFSVSFMVKGGHVAKFWPVWYEQK